MVQPTHRPPKLLTRLFQRLCPDPDRLFLWGDLEELYTDQVLERGPTRAKLWFGAQIFRTLPEILIHRFHWRLSMIKNHLSMAFRQFQRHKGYSSINILGLTLGLTACLLIFLWIQYQSGFNAFHDHSEDIYWLRTWQQYGDRREAGWGSPPAVGPALKAEFPEVMESTRILNGQPEALFTIGDGQHKVQYQMADPSVFKVFTFPWIEGDVEKLADDLHAIVLSESMARRFFGDGQALGQTVNFNQNMDLTVVGVMKDIPQQSSIRFDIWLPLLLTETVFRKNFTQTWYNCSFMTYLRMQPDVDVEAFNKKIFNRIRQSRPETNLDAYIYPFGDLYLKARGIEDRVHLMALIGLFILLVASINYMNLATARSARRAREVGLRKVSGAHRGEIIRQFFGESLSVTALAALLAVGLTAALLPGFRQLAQADIPFSALGSLRTLGVLAALILIMGLLSGSYPALLLSSYRPIRVLKGQVDAGKSGALFRRILVIFQFTLSTLLIIGTLVTLDQSRHLKTMDLGYNRDHLLYVPLEGQLIQNCKTYKQALLQCPGIVNAAASSHNPLAVYRNGSGWQWEGQDPSVDPSITNLFVDEDFLNTLGIKLVEGRGFTHENLTENPYVIINQRLAEIMDQKVTVGAQLRHGIIRCTVLGVVGDFNYTPTTRPIGPIIIAGPNPYADPMRFLFIKVKEENLQETLQFIEKTTRQFNPAFPFTYRFLDDDIQNQYRQFDQMAALHQIFALIAIAISALGLAGLAAFMAERRTKEIGIRRVLGAQVSSIVAMMVRAFLKWVLIANVLAWPLAYLYLKGWLNSFPYRVTLTILPFATALGLGFFLALVSVLTQSLRAATLNPAQTLKDE